MSGSGFSRRGNLAFRAPGYEYHEQPPLSLSLPLIFLINACSGQSASLKLAARVPREEPHPSEGGWKYRDRLSFSLSITLSLSP